MMVYSTGQGVDGFTLDPSIGEFLLSHPDIRIPEQPLFYSANQGYEKQWTDGVPPLHPLAARAGRSRPRAALAALHRLDDLGFSSQSAARRRLLLSRRCAQAERQNSPAARSAGAGVHRRAGRRLCFGRPRQTSSTFSRTSCTSACRCSSATAMLVEKAEAFIREHDQEWSAQLPAATAIKPSPKRRLARLTRECAVL